MKLSKCLITLIVVMFLTSSVNAGNNKPQGSNGGPQSGPSGLSPAPQPGTKSTPSPITQTPGGKPSSSNASTPPGSPSKSSSTIKPTPPSTPKQNATSLSPSQQADLTNRNSTYKFDQASLTEYYAKKQSIDRNYDNKLSELNKTKSGMSQDHYNSKVKSISNDRQYYHSLNEATIKKQSQGHSPESTKSATSSGSTNSTNLGSPYGTSQPVTKSSNSTGPTGSSGSSGKKNSPNQETADGPYWQWQGKHIESLNNQYKNPDAKQKALAEKAGKNHWSPEARSDYQKGMAALDKERASLYQKFQAEDKEYIKKNYPDYYARNYAGKGSSQSFTGIPSQQNVSSPVTTTHQATTTTSTTKKPPFDSSIWSIEKSLQDGRSYNDAPWHNKLVRQWELDQNHPWNPITTPKDPAREAAEKATNDQYKRELEMSKLLWRRSSLPTDKALDFSDPFGKAAVALATGFFEIGRSMATALNWVLPKDKELPIWDDYKDKDGDFKDWPH